jgi:hypothetical protein
MDPVLISIKWNSESGYMATINTFIIARTEVAEQVKQDLVYI